MLNDFQWKPGCFGYYVMRLCVLFESSVLADFVDSRDGERRCLVTHRLGYKSKFPACSLFASVDTRVGSSLLGMIVLPPHLVSTDTSLRVALLLLGDGQSPDTPH